jgi:hypothetical protein
MSLASRRLAAGVLAAWLPLACGASTTVTSTTPSPSGTTSPEVASGATGADADPASIHRARCGKCHVRVEPGARTRDAFARALSRHRKRVKLTEPQWSALLDYLAPPPAVATPQPATPPPT